MRFFGRFLVNLVVVFVIVGVCVGAVYVVGAALIAAGGWLGEYAVPIVCFVLLAVMVALAITIADHESE